MDRWTPSSYRSLPASQQPEYPDPAAAARYLERVRGLPPLVFTGEIVALKQAIAAAGEGKGFILQGGDCVELFADCNRETITNKLKILLQMSVILTYAARSPVVRIGRLAGQYFKPRSSDVERVGETTLPAYRGDGINGIEFSRAARLPDPSRLEAAYFHAAATLNYVRAMIVGGFADLHHPYTWNLYHMERAPRWGEYREILSNITDAVSFMDSFGGARGDSLGDIDFFTSHEALYLGYEEALTRYSDDVAGSAGFYNLGAHMVWIGERTRGSEEAHVEYVRGIRNPVGIKVGPEADPDEIAAVVERVAPDREPGRVMLITRLGADRARERLPAFIDAVRSAGVAVVWSCDPMHGNTRTTAAGVKTRHFDDVLNELSATFAVHAERGTRLSGVHFELTGENVTECTGGGLAVAESDLSRDYRSYCDPRMNYVQSMEMSFLISRYVRTS